MVYDDWTYMVMYSIGFTNRRYTRRLGSASRCGNGRRLYPSPYAKRMNNQGKTSVLLLFPNLTPHEFLLNPRYKHMVVSRNRGTPKSSILMGCSLINQPFWGSPFMETPIYPPWTHAMSPRKPPATHKAVFLILHQGISHSVSRWILSTFLLYRPLKYTTIWWFPKIGVPPNHPFSSDFPL